MAIKSNRGTGLFWKQRQYKTMDRKTGARGLRSIMENVLLDTMYDLPSMETVSKVVIDEAVINGESKPLMIYDGPEMDELASAAAE